MHRRLMLAAGLSALVALGAAAPVGAKDFGSIWVEDTAYRTFANPARVDPGTGTDPIIAFTNFNQDPVAQYAPGRGSHGGRWAVEMATWNDPANARLVTDYGDAKALELAGELTIVRAPQEDFRCPILPNG
jgi:hypothetical protein